MAAVILFHPERPWTANSSRAAKHWTVNASRTKAWRLAFQVLATEAGVPALGPCRVIVTPYLAKGPTQDVGACSPAAKAAIDGLVDAGVWPDDSPKHVVELVFRAPVRRQRDGLMIEIVSAVSAMPGAYVVRAA